MHQEIAMRKRISVALAAGLLMVGVSAASAAGMQQPKASAAGMSQSNTPMTPRASDTLSLNSTQRQAAWKDLYMGSLNQTSPSLNATRGAVLPSSIATAPVTTKAAGDVPALKPFDFAMVNGKLLIVNPSDKKIVDVISG
jgi:Spy/CpxP family protein refolding chaperone